MARDGDTRDGGAAQAGAQVVVTAGSRRTGRAHALQLLYAQDGDPSADVAGGDGSWVPDTIHIPV